MSTRIWHKGPPPFVGWWNASIERADDVWRWWNGKQWGIAVKEGDSNFLVTAFARERTILRPDEIEWTDYWPKNARVPRIDPREAA